MSVGENKRGEGITGYLPLGIIKRKGKGITGYLPLGIIKRKGKGIADTFPLLVTPVRLELTTQ